MINSRLPLVEKVRWVDDYFAEIKCYDQFSFDELVKHTHNYLRGIFWEDFFLSKIPSDKVDYPTDYVFDNGKTVVMPHMGYRGGVNFVLIPNAENTSCRFSLGNIHLDKVQQLQGWVSSHKWKDRLEQLGSPPKLTDIPKATFDLYASTFPGGLFALKRYYQEQTPHTLTILNKLY